MGECKAGKKHRDFFLIFQKYFRTIHFMKFYITTYLYTVFNFRILDLFSIVGYYIISIYYFNIKINLKKQLKVYMH